MSVLGGWPRGLAVVLIALAPAWASAASIETAKSLIAEGRYPDALVELDRYIADNPEDTSALFLRALLLARTEHEESAIDAFHQLARNDMRRVEALNNLGVLYARQQRFEEARTQLEKAVELAPDNSEVHENLGDVRVALARRAYRRATETRDDSRVVRKKLARLSEDWQPRDELDLVRMSGAIFNPGAARSEQRPTRRDQDAAAASGDPIRAAVQAWASAWSDQDVQAYLDAYSADFEPADNPSRAQWERERRQHVSVPARIRVELSDVQVERLSDDRALATFEQHYRAPGYEDVERKGLLMRREGGEWRILAEGGVDRLRSMARDAERTAASESAETRPLREAVRKAVRAWARAWQSKDLEAYFDAYSEAYAPEGGQSRSAWMRERRERIRAPEFIEVELDDIQVEMRSGDRARVRFLQRYRSDDYRDRERKTLDLRRERDGRWRIIRER